MTAPAPRGDDLRLVRDVTANFFFWQGLRWVPMGAALIVFALARTPAIPLADGARDVISAAALLLALWLSTTVAGAYYHRTFGDVRAIPGMHARRDTVKWLVVYPLMFGAMIVDAELTPPIFISAIVFAGGILAYRQSTGRGRVHYFAAAAILALFGLLPLTGAVVNGKGLLGPFLGLLGAIYVVGGVLDHRELTHILRPPPGEDLISDARQAGGDVRTV